MVVDVVTGLDAVSALWRKTFRATLRKWKRSSRLHSTSWLLATSLALQADVELQSQFISTRRCAAEALKAKPGNSICGRRQPWAYFDNYIMALQCVNTLTPTWSNKLAAFDVFIWDQCYAMEQSLRIE
jgi:hypothetical protein